MRIDEFKKSAYGFLSIRDMIRFTCVGFDITSADASPDTPIKAAVSFIRSIIRMVSKSERGI